MNAMKRAAVFMLLCAGMVYPSWASAGPIPPTYYTEDVPIPSGSGPQSEYEIEFAGNQTATLTPTINPFPHGTTSVTYDSADNTTTMVFEGNPLAPGHSYHFGYSEVGGTTVPHGFGSPEIVQQNWLPARVLLPAPTLTVGVGPPHSGAGTFLLAYVGAESFVGSFSYFTSWWWEIWVPFGVLFPVAILNFDDDDPDDDGFPGVRPLIDGDPDTPLQLDNASYFFSPTQIPLSDLNDSSLPPSDPRWQPSGIPDGTTLGAGDSATFYVNSAPEPASLTLFGIGAAVLGGYGWRRRRQLA